MSTRRIGFWRHVYCVNLLNSIIQAGRSSIGSIYGCIMHGVSGRAHGMSLGFRDCSCAVMLYSRAFSVP
jgi:hypothetical protein